MANNERPLSGCHSCAATGRSWPGAPLPSWYKTFPFWAANRHVEDIESTTAAGDHAWPGVGVEFMPLGSSVMTIEFEWDATKAKTNLGKHRISFEEATSAFYDALSVTIADRDHSVNESDSCSLG
jgi:hypothetical protein